MWESWLSMIILSHLNCPSGLCYGEQKIELAPKSVVVLLLFVGMIGSVECH